ncbi:MAG: TonB-dependent receptor [Ferruginibacter sp.]
MKQKLLLIAALILTCAFGAKAQSTSKITGLVKDVNGNNIIAATIALHKTKDSQLVKTAVSNNAGQYELLNIKAGTYFVTVNALGMQKASTPAITVGENETATAPLLSLKPASKSLEGVTVVSQKPMVEVKADKMVMNVEGTINAVGNDALELLRKAPGVIVDKDDNISLAGKNGVQVYIDGKPSPLSGTDLANYLKSLQSSQVESVELITNPSAKYEAAGNAGIINIKLKKNKTLGTNGSVNAGYNVGTYGRYNAGINLNHRSKKSNIYGSYNFAHALNLMQFSMQRSVLDTFFDQHSEMKILNTNHNFKTGVDFFLNKKSTLGLMVTGNINDNNLRNLSKTPKVYIPTGVMQNQLVADNSTDGNRNNVNFNANYKYTGTKGDELNLDADYGMYRIRSNQLQPNFYYDVNNHLYQTSKYNFIAPADINILAIKADYEQNFKKGKLGYGAKTSFVNTNNHFERYTVYNNGSVLDVPRSNEFNYTENINALYVNYNKQYKGKMVQLGVRMEHTKSSGDTYGLNYDGSVNKSTLVPFERNYVNLFPSASVTFNKNPMKQWSFSYSRRIDRPAYQNLNPFEFKLDEYTYQKGNTNLKPQYSDIISITNVYKYMLTTKLSYSHVKDMFTQIVDTAEKSKTFISQKNLATQDVISLNISYPFQRKWYSMFVNVNTYYSMYKADFGGGSRNIDLNVGTLSLYMQHSFKLGKGFTAELSGFYNSPTVWQGTFKSKALWSADAGISKPVLKNKGNIKASFTDMFRTLRFKGSANFAGQSSTFSGYGDSRQFKINFNYRFGSMQVKAARNRNSATEDESKRTQGGGGIGIGN